MRNPPLCTPADIKGHKYTINDFADMHEAMDAEDEYARRVEEAKKK